jgi:hypothetical protein
MDYISDRTLFKAIMFARRMIGRNNQVPSNAIRIAAKYYEVDASKVARYVGQAAGTTRWRKETE